MEPCGTPDDNYFSRERLNYGSARSIDFPRAWIFYKMANPQILDEYCEGKCPEQEALRLMCNDLCNTLSINNLFPSLISNRVIDFNDKIEICAAEQTEVKRVEYLLSHKICKPLSVYNTEPFYNFLRALKQDHNSSFIGSRLEDCLKTIQHEKSPDLHGKL